MDDDAPPGVPEWVVTYGDMMSLLLTFFIMLVSLSEVKANQKFRSVLESLQKSVGYRAGPIVPPGTNFPLNSLRAGKQQLGSHTDDGKGKGGIKSPQSLDGDDLRVHAPRHGRSVPAGELILFAPFEAKLSDEASAVIVDIASKLAGKPNKVEVCGHTSQRPLPAGSPYGSVLELSYARSRLVFDRLTQLGIERERLRMVAFGDRDPLPASHDVRALRDDRVAVLVLDAYRDEYVGPRDGRR
jgi:chemotaxis protein MotB